MKRVKLIEYIDDNVCRVTFEDYTTIELDSFSVSQSGISAGEDAEDDIIEDLIFTSGCIKAQKAALKYLNNRLRTEKQLIKRLKESGLDDAVVYHTVDEMKRWGYIDDAAYARAYIKYRLDGSKKSWRAIFYDLKTEGVASDVINEVSEEYDTDEHARAREVAQKVLNGRSDEASIKRLKGILARNGFCWDAIESAANAIYCDD